MADEDKRSFEVLLGETEEHVEALESGELSLDESLKVFELGIRNLRLCSCLIRQAEDKVTTLFQSSNGEFALKDFGLGEDEEGDE